MKTSYDFSKMKSSKNPYAKRLKGQTTIDGLWNRVGQTLKRKGYSKVDIPILIKECRKVQKGGR